MLPVFAGEFGELVLFLLEVIGEAFFFFGIELAAKFFALCLELERASNDGLIFADITLFHCLISRLEVANIGVIALQIIVRRLAAQRWAAVRFCGG